MIEFVRAGGAGARAAALSAVLLAGAITAGAVLASVAPASVAWSGVAPASVAPGMMALPPGAYLPLYRQAPLDSASRATGTMNSEPARRVAVEAFELDVHPVTNADYLAFVRQHPEWRRSRVKRLFADESYLRHWKGDLEPGPNARERSPVVNVSWFAARAYCRTLGKQLPTVDQWEYAAAASPSRRDASRDSVFQNRLHVWYGRPIPTPLPEVGTTFRNVFGIEDMYGLIWEWTLDFSSALVTGESRADASLERSLYCGAGAAGATDFENYAAFMRYAFRSSLQARYCVANLGFRGARAPGLEHAGARP